MSTEQATQDQEQPAQALQRLPEPALKRNISEAQWLTLRNSLFPGASPASVILVWDYCQARGLDPMKKPCHIVPMEVNENGAYRWRDVVMPGIYEYRTTAHRTGEYLGHEEPKFGEDVTVYGVTAPKWCDFTVYRYNVKSNAKVPFPVRVYFSEVVATKRDKETKEFRANARWSRAPIQMLTKCAEAAALREAFPEELGGEHTAEEMDGRTIDAAYRVEDTTAPAWQVVFDKLPEALRDTVEKALAALGLGNGARIAKLNEYFGAPNVDPDDAAKRLLAWAEAETKKPKATADPKQNQSRGKKADAPADPKPAEPVADVKPAAPTPPVVSGLPQAKQPVIADLGF